MVSGRSRKRKSAKFRRATAKTVVLTHCISMLDAPGIADSVLGEMRAVFGGAIIVGRPLMAVPREICHPHRVE